jgi:hypothetical protein
MGGALFNVSFTFGDRSRNTSAAPGLSSVFINLLFKSEPLLDRRTDPYNWSSLDERRIVSMLA